MQRNSLRLKCPDQTEGCTRIQNQQAESRVGLLRKRAYEKDKCISPEQPRNIILMVSFPQNGHSVPVLDVAKWHKPNTLNPNLASGFTGGFMGTRLFSDPRACRKPLMDVCLTQSSFIGPFQAKLATHGNPSPKFLNRTQEEMCLRRILFGLLHRTHPHIKGGTFQPHAVQIQSIKLTALSLTIHSHRLDLKSSQ